MSQIFMNFGSGHLSENSGVGPEWGPVLWSNSFQELPEVVLPNTLRIVLDPEGLGGAPEIVTVFSHAAFATSLQAYRATEGTPIRDHPPDTVWRHILTRASLLEIAVPAGTVNATIGATPDPGYVFIDGSTVANCQTIYPATWDRIPTSWKSDDDMVMPDWRGKTLFSNDVGALFALGGMGGSNTHFLTQPELPAATIAINPPPTAVTVNDPTHGHSGTTAGANARHHHPNQTTINTGPGVVINLHGTAEGTNLGFLQSGDDTPDHGHPFNTNGVATGITASVDIVEFQSGPLGAGAAIDTRPAHGVVNWQLKVH